MKPKYKAYIVTNLLNGKRYIGITSTGIARRWARHLNEAPRRKGPLQNAITKYGASAFSIEWCASALDWPSLLELERLLISQEGTYRLGYNATKGGQGVLGVRLSRATIARIARINSALLKGVKKSAAHRAAISKGRAGMTFSDEHRRNIGLAATGRVTSARAKVKLSAAMRRHRRTARPANAHLSDEVVLRIKAAISLGRRNCDIARELAIKPQIVGEIKAGKTYRHLTTAVAVSAA